MCQIYRNIENLDHIRTQTSDFCLKSQGNLVWNNWERFLIFAGLSKTIEKTTTWTWTRSTAEVRGLCSYATCI
jgi:hypothetical protein